MKTFKEHVDLQERFVNLFTKDVEKRKEFVDQVWDILNKSYAKQGGMIGNGFESKEAMIKKIPFWKLNAKNGKVTTVAMFKDKGGRKRVAMGTDGSPEAKEKVKEMMLNDLKLSRSWGEISGRAWGFMKKSVPEDLLKASLIPVKTVIKLSPGKDIIPAYGNDPDIKSTDPFRDFWFMRALKDGKPHSKLAVGTPGNKMY